MSVHMRVERRGRMVRGRRERRQQDGVAVVCGVVYHQVSYTERATAALTLWACDV